MASLTTTTTLPELYLELDDTEWPRTFTDHDRVIARAIVVDEEGYYYFVRVERDDVFGKATLIETAGGGVEPGETLPEAVQREVQEELGVKIDLLGKLGLVKDYYHRIHRRNLNHYFLGRVRAWGSKQLTEEEQHQYHLSTLRLTYEAAVQEYERCRCTKFGILLAHRELPILQQAKRFMDQEKGTVLE